MAIELLSPAGSTDALRAAFLAGADAVYIGGNRYGARAFADNPDDEALLDAINLTHRLGRKLYLTVNTLLKEEEAEDVCRWFRPFYEQGVDAVIVQDLGVVRLFRTCFPDLPLHASTQMAVTGSDGVRLLQSLGICRVVPARELSLKELQQIRQETGIELETFIHGALCYSYSGMCLMSSLIGGRSGNRGRCAGICRLPFKTEWYWEDSHAETWPLNMKDLCTIQMLPSLAKAGVTSFKIEGRMKKPEYTYGVTAAYRKALDAYQEGRWDSYDPAGVLHILTALYNRDGFTDGYYERRNGSSMVALRNDKLLGKRAAEAQKTTEQFRRDIREKEKSNAFQRQVSGKVILRADTPAVCILHLPDTASGWKSGYEIRIEKDAPGKAKTMPATEEQVRQQMLKTGQSPFCFSRLEIEMDPDLFVPVRLIKELRREAFRKLEEMILAGYRRDLPDPSVQIPCTGTGSAGGSQFADASAEQKDAVRRAPLLCALVHSREQLHALLPAEEIHTVYLPLYLRDLAEEVKIAGKQVFLALPYILRRDDPDYREAAEALKDRNAWDGVLLRNLEEAGLYRRLREEGQAVIKEPVLDAFLYSMNQNAAAVYADWGFASRTLPYELNFQELRDLDTRGSQLVIYGRIPMMISAQCIRKTENRCTKQRGWTVLKDRTSRQFPVLCDCTSCVNIIYNSLPLSLIQEAGAIRHLECASYRMDFTDEGEEQTRKTAEAVIQVFGHGQKPVTGLPASESTKGHFRRGVE